MASPAIDRLRAAVNARETAMNWAMQTAMPGEDAMTTLARAQLYEEWVMEPLGLSHDSTGLRPRVTFDGGEVRVHR